MDPIILGSIIKIGGELIDRIFPDKEKAAEAKLKLFEMEQKGELAKLAATTELAKGQLEINKVEAASRTPFVSGWRPSVGWICSFALAYNFIVQPMLAWAAAFREIPIPPSLDLGPLMALLFGMLGLGAYRSVEKVRGVAK